MNRKWQCILALMTAGACAGRAAILADWTFETSRPSGNGGDITGIVPENGDAALSSIASGHHADTSTAWSNPQGDTSANSFSANRWTEGDYFQFKTTTLAYNQIVISFEQISSSTGPTGFKLTYSTDGTTFVDVNSGSYTVVNPTDNNWATGGSLKPSIESFDLSSITAVNNDNTIYFRLIDTTTPGSSAGASRVDDFKVSGMAIVPESAATGLAYGAGALVIAILQLRRERRSVCG